MMKRPPPRLYANFISVQITQGTYGFKTLRRVTVQETPADSIKPL